MTITAGLVTLAEIRARLQFATDDTADDSILEAVVMGVSRLIENYCGRKFYADTADATRYYTAEFADLLFLDDDLISVTTLKTDTDGDRTYETTWTASTHYELEPANASVDGQPYTRIATAPNSAYLFPVGMARGVQVVGKFGYATTVPTAVKEACLLQCERIYKRKDAPFGVLGSAEMGQMMVLPKLDPDVALLLSGYQRVRVGGV